MPADASGALQREARSPLKGRLTAKYSGWGARSGSSGLLLQRKAIPRVRPGPWGAPPAPGARVWAAGWLFTIAVFVSVLAFLGWVS